MSDEDRFSRREDSSLFEGERSYFAEQPFEDRGNHPDYGRGIERDGPRWEGQARDRTSEADVRARSWRDEPYEARAPRGVQNRAPSERMRDERETELMHWHERDETPYFGTGTYYGSYSTGPSARASGSAYGDRGYLGAGANQWRERPTTWHEENPYAGSSGRYESYGQSRFGSQGGYDRPYGRSSRRQSGYGQDYREQFAEQRYGRDPAFGYGFDSGSSSRTSFRGRGPKGYQRSDERLREMICERLTDDPRIDASEVHIEVKDKTVKLTGTVDDRRTKYEIEDLIEQCGGVSDIDNQIRLRRGKDRSG